MLALGTDEYYRFEGFKEKAMIQSSLGNSEEALEEYLKAINLNPESSGVHVSIGDIYYQQGNLDQAIRHYRSAVALPPELPWKRYLLGKALLETGQVNEGLQELEVALSLASDDENLANMINALTVRYGASG